MGNEREPAHLGAPIHTMPHLHMRQMRCVSVSQALIDDAQKLQNEARVIELGQDHSVRFDLRILAKSDCHMFFSCKSGSPGHTDNSTGSDVASMSKMHAHGPQPGRG